MGLAIPELKDEAAVLANLDGESVDERIRRRLSRWTPIWTPMTLHEPTGHPH